MGLYYVKTKHEKTHFKVTSVSPIYIPAGIITANDLNALKAWFEISDCTAGINGGNPGTVVFQYSPDDEATWIDIPAQNGGSFTGNGVDFHLEITANSGIFPPVVRYKFTAPANESYTVVNIRRIHTLPGVFYGPPAASSGGIFGFGAVGAAGRSAAQLGAVDVVPVPAATGYNYLTSTSFTKTVANDGQALDVYIRGALAAFSAALQFNRNGTLTTPVLDTTTAANNRPLPSVQVAGDSLAPVAMGTGADGATVQRVTLSTRHEAVTTPVATRISDSTEFTTAHENYELNTQFVKAAKTLRLPVSANLNGWDFTNNTRKELRADTNGDLQTKVMNQPTSIINSNVLVPVNYDTIVPNFAGALTDVYVYKTGGVGGATVATVTITYVAIDKAVIASIVRT